MRWQNQKFKKMNKKKTTFALVIAVLFALLLNFYPQHTSLAEDPAGPGNECFWGYASVERSWWPPSNNGSGKLCDCTRVYFILDGNHTPCPQPE